MDDDPNGAATPVSEEDIDADRSNQTNADTIHAVERTTHAPRGNVHSEEDDQPPEQDAPPPFPN